MEHHIVKCAHIEISIDGRDQPALQLGFACVRRTMTDCARDTADKLIGKALPKCIEHAGFAAELMVEGSFGDTGPFVNVINIRGVNALLQKQRDKRYEDDTTPATGPPRDHGNTGPTKA